MITPAAAIVAVQSHEGAMVPPLRWLKRTLDSSIEGGVANRVSEVLKRLTKSAEKRRIQRVSRLPRSMALSLPERRLSPCMTKSAGAASLQTRAMNALLETNDGGR
jgi:hypothetical protein